jgi:cytochrome b
MRDFRAPVIGTHLTTYYVLLILILLHIVGVVTTELRKGGAIISAMITGRKILSVNPETELEKPPVE